MTQFRVILLDDLAVIRRRNQPLYYIYYEIVHEVQK